MIHVTSRGTISYFAKYACYRHIGTHEPQTTEDWKSILHLATLWQFDDIREFAIRELCALPMNPVEKVVLSRKYSICSRWTLDAYTELCERPEPLGIDEARQLGLETVTRVAQLREKLYKRSAQNNGRRTTTGGAENVLRRSLDVARPSSLDSPKKHQLRNSLPEPTLILRRSSVSGENQLPVVSRLVAQTFGLDAGEHT